MPKQEYTCKECGTTITKDFEIGYAPNQIAVVHNDGPCPYNDMECCIFELREINAVVLDTEG